jgi:hypothetical protein
VQKRINGESPPTQLPGPKHRCRRGPGPTTSPPTKGGGHASQPGCGRTLGAAAPQAAWPGPTSASGCMTACLVGFGWFPYLPTSNRPSTTIRRGWSSPLDTTSSYSYTSHHTLYSFHSFSSSF